MVFEVLDMRSCAYHSARDCRPRVSPRCDAERVADCPNTKCAFVRDTECKNGNDITDDAFISSTEVIIYPCHDENKSKFSPRADKTIDDKDDGKGEKEDTSVLRHADAT